MSYKKPQLPSVHFADFRAHVPDLTGKTFVITGTTSGTGRVAARTIAEHGGRVIMLNRASSRSEHAQRELGSATPAGRVQTVECDLQSFTSVRAACEGVREIAVATGIFALINNAGIMAMPDEATEDGYDTQMQTNHLSHFLLTQRLFDLLERGAERHGSARIVNHSSIARLGVKRLEARYLEANGGSLGGNGSGLMMNGARWTRYSQTKLANAAFTAALHHRLRGADSKVRALVAHPGWANTELQVTTHEAGGMGAWIAPVARFISQSEEDGTLGILSAAVLPDAACGTFHGPGMSMRATRGPATAYPLEPRYDNADTRDLLWEKSCEAVGVEWSL